MTPERWILYDREFARYAHGVEDALGWIIPAGPAPFAHWCAPAFTPNGRATLAELVACGPPPGTWPRYSSEYVMSLACWFPSQQVADALGMGRRNIERICRLHGPDVIAHLPKFAHRAVYARYK